MDRCITIVIAKTVFGAGLALGLAAMPHALAHTDTVAGYDAYAAEVGDDNADGVITEDESGWSCVDHGNHICGLGNPQGVPAGRYDEGGVLIDPWPVTRWRGHTDTLVPFGSGVFCAMRVAAGAGAAGGTALAR